MAKKIIQDIIVNKNNFKPVRKDLVKEQSLPRSERLDNFNLKESLCVTTITKKRTLLDQINEENNRSTKNSRLILWTVCVICVATLLFFIFSIFSTAKITITPKVEAVSLNDTYTAFASSSSQSSGELYYDILTVEKELSKQLETDGEENVERKATGKAILYNNYSTSKQRLINNTRLQTADGLVYRIRESIDVPGYKTVNGVKTPGSVEVNIIADVAGEKYNMKVADLKGDFTIPGFKGLPQYNSFYARLSSNISGGYIGLIKKVSDTKLTQGRQELKDTLKTDLIKYIYSTTSDAQIIFKDNYFVEYTDMPDSSDGSDYSIVEKAVIHAIVFDKKRLASFIANNKITNFDGSSVDVLWNDNILVSFGSTTKPWIGDSLKPHFEGDVNVVWSYDSNKIVNEIKGQNKSIISEILKEYDASVKQIEVNIKPQWLKTFPKNSSRIKVVDSIRDTVGK